MNHRSLASTIINRSRSGNSDALLLVPTRTTIGFLNPTRLNKLAEQLADLVRTQSFNIELAC